MATPATDVLDCRFLHEKMEAWDCADDLEKFILQYKKRTGENGAKTPSRGKSSCKGVGDLAS